MRLQNHAVHLAVKRSHDLDVQLAEIDENHVHRNISASEEQICSYASESGAKLLHRARTMLVKLAKEHGLKLRQGNPKVGKRMKYQRLRMPSSSSARVARCDPSRHIWAASSATSIAKSDHRRRYRAPFDRSSMTRWR